MRVKDVMTSKMHFCTPDDTVQHAAQLMKKYEVGAIPVVQSLDLKKISGILTDRDIAMKVVSQGKPVTTPVAGVMSKTVITCKQDDPLGECESLMEKHQVRRIPVVDGQGFCVGIVAQADVAMREDAKHVKEMVSAVSHRPNSAAA